MNPVRSGSTVLVAALLGLMTLSMAVPAAASERTDATPTALLEQLARDDQRDELGPEIESSAARRLPPFAGPVLWYTYDCGPDFGGASPSHCPVDLYDTPTDLRDPVADGGGVGRAFSGLRADRVAPRTAPVGARACSFSGATLVLMADGSRKPIEDIEVGDNVLATDPETGETVAREVTHLWVHGDTLVDLIVDGNVITTTEDHPFWNETDREWQRADHLDEGDLVHSADGQLLEVQGLDWSSAHTATAYNLTVDDIHTYYVGAGDDTVLVHNTCGFRADLIDEYRFNPGSHVEAHHVVPQGHRNAAQARAILGDDVTQNAGLNGVFLRRGNGGLHNATLPDAYVSSVNQRIVDANRVGGRAAALDELTAMRDELAFLQRFIP